MPRTLPWLAEAAKKKEPKKMNVSLTPAKRRADDSDDDLVDSDLNSKHPSTPPQRAKQTRNLARTPSTSPPPAPPDVEYMREGFDAEDIYMMVEDEFYAMAKTFTQHIHHAEYVRLKKLARSRGEGLLRDISRPTDGRTETSVGLRMKMEAAEKAKKIRKGLGGEEGSGEEEEDEYLQDPLLAGLMKNQQEGGKDLGGMLKAKSNTRAAAGFLESPHHRERKRDALGDGIKAKTAGASTITQKTGKAVIRDDCPSAEEDILDAAPIRSSETVLAKDPHKKCKTIPLNGNELRVVNGQSLKSQGLFKRFAGTTEDAGPKASLRVSSSAGRSERGHKELDPESRRSTSPTKDLTSSTARSAAAEYLTKRRMEKERKAREEKRKATRADDIPTFFV